MCGLQSGVRAAQQFIDQVVHSSLLDAGAAAVAEQAPHDTRTADQCSGAVQTLGEQNLSVARSQSSAPLSSNTSRSLEDQLAEANKKLADAEMKLAGKDRVIEDQKSEIEKLKQLVQCAGMSQGAPAESNKDAQVNTQPSHVSTT